MTKIKLGVNLS